MRRRSILLLFAAVVFITFFGQFLYAAEEGDSAPAFVLTDMQRNYVFSKKVYGTGWLLIDFYATWCENCNEELPHVEELYSDFKDSGFGVLVMATDAEGLDVVAPFFTERPTELKVLIDKYQKAVEAFGVEALPTMFLVDPDGRIAFKSVGYHEEDIAELRRILSDGGNG